MMDDRAIERYEKKVQRHRRRIYNVHSPARRKALVAKRMKEATKHGAAKASVVSLIVEHKSSLSD